MDFIYVTNNNNEKEIMEVVTIYNMNNSKYNYIIYKSIIENEYYIGKYKGENIVDIDTNLNEKEMKYAEIILKELVGE